MSHYFCLFVNFLRMSEDNKALLTYLLTLSIPGKVGASFGGGMPFLTPTN